MVTISDKSVIRLHPLERQVLEKLLTLTERELSAHDLQTLEIQLAQAIILSREMTGHGFYTRFFAGENCPRLPEKKSFWFGSVYADVPRLRHGAGFHLYIKEGAIDQLEGFCFDGHWPDPWPGQYDESEIYEVSEMPRSGKLETNQ
jgi:hypothetical protein